MVVVIDANVFIGACLGRGAANQVVAQCLQGTLQPLMEPALMTEYEDVLGRQALFARSRLDSAERDELFDIFLGRCRWTRIYFGWRPNLRDEGDNHLIELAVAGGADCIVTRNLRDLNTAQLKFPDLRILTPEHLLREASP